MLFAAFGTNELLTVIAHAAAGAVAANVLVAGAVICGQKSLISPERKLPLDDDDKVIQWLAIAGAGIAILLTFLYGPTEAMSGGYFIVTTLVTFALGTFVPLSLTTRLNDEYMRRAILCYEEGDYEGAFEDASEVLRSCDRYPQAAEIVNATRQHRWADTFGPQTEADPNQYRYAAN